MINWIAFPHFLNSINKVTAEKLLKIGQNPKTIRNKTDNGNLEPESRWTNAQAHDRYESWTRPGIQINKEKTKTKRNEAPNHQSSELTEPQQQQKGRVLLQ